MDLFKMRRIFEALLPIEAVKQQYRLYLLRRSITRYNLIFSAIVKRGRRLQSFQARRAAKPQV